MRGAILKQGKYIEAEQLLITTIQLDKEVLRIQSNIVDELLGNQVDLLIDPGQGRYIIVETSTKLSISSSKSSAQCKPRLTHTPSV